MEIISISYEWGGIEQHVKDLSTGLKNRGHKVIVVCRDFKLHVDAYSEYCQVHTLPIRNSVDLQTIWGLSKLIKREQIDIVHTHTSRDAWIALFATWLAHRGKVITTRHVPFLAKQDAFHTWYYNQLSGIICVSEFVKSRFLGDNPKIKTDKVQVIYPGIRICRDKTVVKRIVRDRFAISDNTFLIGFVGRLTVEKGVDNLLDALALLKEKKENFKLVLVGEVNPMTPDYLDHLKTKAQQLGVAHYIEFFGFSKDVTSIMHDIDVLVQPSIHPETFGLVLCEAILASKPVISTAAGAQGEIITDGVNGFLVPVSAPEAIAEKLMVIMEAEDGFGGKGEFSIEFLLDNTIDRLENFFENVLKNESVES